MSLIGFENLQTLSTYLGLFYKGSKLFQMLNYVKNLVCPETSVWTSGSNEGNLCDTERTYAWCATGALISPAEVNRTENWVDVPDAAKAPSQRCLLLTATAAKVGLSHSGCEEKRPFLCEVNKYNLYKFEVNKF